MHKAASYAEAQKWAKRHPNQPVQWDGGAGWTCEGYWHSQWRRFVCRTFNPATGGFC